MPPTREAKEGTVAHTLAALCLAGGHEPQDFVSRFVDEYEVTEEMAEAVTVYTDYVRKQLADENGQTDLDKASTLDVEKFVSLETIDKEIGGTTDAKFYNRQKQVLHVVDLKYGAGVAVEAKGNRQLAIYGIGALIQLKEPAKLVRLTIVQPRADHPDGPVRTWNVSRADLRDIALDLRLAAEATRKPDAPLQDGPWCRFCDAAGVCPRLTGIAEQAASYEADDAVLAATGGTLDPAEIGRRLALVAPLRMWMTGITKLAWAEAQRGRVPDGYKLVAVRGRRAWKDGDLAMRQALRAFPFDIGEDDVFKRTPVTPRQLEKLVGESQAAEFVAAHIAQKRKSVALVPASDTRPTVLPAVLSEFDDLIEEGHEDDGETEDTLAAAAARPADCGV